MESTGRRRVKCPCGWAGRRDLETATEAPCPSCGRECVQVTPRRAVSNRTARLWPHVLPSTAEALTAQEAGRLLDGFAQASGLVRKRVRDLLKTGL